MFREFIRHLFPQAVLSSNLKIGYTFCLGGLAFTAFLLLSVSGILLACYYQPSPERAYESILFLESEVYGGLYLRSLHRLASHLFLVLTFLHTLRVLLTGAYQDPRHMNWLIGCGLLGLGVFAGYTGYLLPMDQLAYWATRTGMELLRGLPFGESLHDVLVPDATGGGLSLLRFYVLHIAVLPTAILTLSYLHFYLVRKHKGLLPYL
jgi:quinol-cytochrome oxidoreductase complex cytochrome b subunit